jgi:hypothetical protein
MEKWQEAVEVARRREREVMAREGDWDYDEMIYATLSIAILSICGTVACWLWVYPWLWSKIAWMF